MKIFYSPNSPYVRKVMITAIELGNDQQLEKAPVTLSPYEPNPLVTAENPLGKIPVLVTGQGDAIFDSVVICEYLAAQAGNKSIFPADAAVRWKALSLNALADGMLEAAMAMRFEAARPEQYRYAKWSEAQGGKLDRAFAWLDSHLPDGVDIGAIALASTLGWLDFRFPDLGWRDKAPRLASWFSVFSQRESFATTAPPA
ncbi:MAG TPA: glutathione S-transferase [Noviherbaspirillum sp.]|nr:glutathione S-transferase [Noviherbaspirillum sp.]